ncbi:MAG: DNA polymerase III subunit alpha [Caldilineaceae bacterium]|nr:DNA polymerase III subunit alpha [Caldilineaceae bacterium]
MSENFVHLHTHSEYSLLDGLGRIKNLVAEAKKLGQPALALTDHGVMHGAVEFFRAAKYADIKPIIGVESYQTVWGRPMDGRDSQFDRENYHLLLLAKNMTGYRNLLKICSNSQLNGYYYRPRIDHEFLANHAEGLIATTGCMGAEVPQLIHQGKEQEAYERLGWYVDLFGKENFFIELQEHSIPDLISINKVMVPWAEKFGIQLLATNDVHYVREQDSGPHDVLLCVQTGTTVQAKERMRLSDGSYFLKSRAQMEDTFRPLIDLPASAFDNSVLIAEMCDVDLEDENYHLPDIPIPDGFTYESYLRHLTEEGLARLYGESAQNDVVQERKERELQIIHQMGFDIYFLIVADLCNFARSRNIWWNVRGSGAGSLVAYCVGITGIDPLKNNLIFERFLNPGRVSMPDFDLDFPDDQREEMIRYTVNKFGEDQVAQIATFGRMKARAAVRDVGRAKAVDLSQVDRIAKLIPAIPGKPATIQDVLTEGHEFYSPDLAQLYQNEPWARDLLDTSMQVEGVARHSSVHAAAVIVADRELTHYTPLMRGNKNTVTSTITQYEFPILESIGLLKVDFLGLSTLSVMREASRLIRERHGIAYTLSNIPIEGEESVEAFKLLSSGEVSGVFQVEGQGMRRVLTEMRPSTFEHIVATISLYRPGPLEYIPAFIKRMHGEEEVEFKHSSLENILGETYGICVYQEQIIQILSQLAGYTPGDADLVRRAISKKKASDIEKHKKIFVEGCYRNGIPKDVSAAIYGDIEFFARYGFNKSHAADYAVICVQTAFLKAHYPVEYMAALLLIERDKTEKVINFINECRRMGIDVLPPDVNHSGLDFEIQTRPADTESNSRRDANIAYQFPVPEDSAIRFGMAAVKNVGEGPVKVILAAREEGGPFTSLEDFCERVDLRQVNKRALECLIKVGAFDRFGKRSQILEVLEQMMAQSAAVFAARDSGQLSMFDLMSDLGGGDATSVSPIRLPDIEEVKGRDKLLWEKELLGVYAMSHPLQALSVDVRNIVTCGCSELDERYDGKNVLLVGMIASVRTINTKKGDQMAFVQLEDMGGQGEVVVFPRTYAEVKELLALDSIVMVKGKAQAREGQTSVLADSFQTYVDQILSVGPDPQYQKPLLDVLPTINGFHMEESRMSDENGSSNGFPGYSNGMGSFAGDDDDAAYMEESPFANEPPAWLNAEMTSEPMPERAAISIPAAPAAIAPARQEQAAPDNPYLHESRNLREEDGDFNIPLPESMRNDPAALAQAEDDDEPAGEKATEKATEQAAPDNPYLHESRNLREEDGDFEIALPKSLQDEPEMLADNEHEAETPSQPNRAIDAAGEEAKPPQAHTNGHQNGHANGNGNANGNGQSNGTSNGQNSAKNSPKNNGHSRKQNGQNSLIASGKRTMQILFRPSGDLDRDKYRLKQIVDTVRDPKGRDQFLIVLKGHGKITTLAFPDDPCSISDRLRTDLSKFFRVEVEVKE